MPPLINLYACNVDLNLCLRDLLRFKSHSGLIQPYVSQAHITGQVDTTLHALNLWYENLDRWFIQPNFGANVSSKTLRSLNLWYANLDGMVYTTKLQCERLVKAMQETQSLLSYVIAFAHTLSRYRID